MPLALDVAINVKRVMEQVERALPSIKRAGLIVLQARDLILKHFSATHASQAVISATSRTQHAV